MNPAKLLSRLGPQWLPFADAATRELPMRRLARLGLFQISVGLTLALLAGTLNRVMIVEMMIAALLVAVFLMVPMLTAPIRAVLGHKSDHHRSAFGWRRVPYLWFGTFLQFVGLALIPFALILLNGQAEYGANARLVGLIGGGLAFVIVGVGAHAVQTAGLALATDLAPEAARPRVVSFLYVNFLIGLLIGGLGYSVLLREFSNLALVQVVKSSALLVLLLNVIALWKQEAIDPERAQDRTPPPPFREAWRNLIAQPGARRLLYAVGFGSAGFAMQDVLLEPYGGQILGMGVAATSMLTAISAVGALLAFGIAARMLPRGLPVLLLASLGLVSGTFAFALVVVAPTISQPSLLYAGAFLIGFGGGLFTVGTLNAAMQLDSTVGGGLAVGAWGAVYASCGGLAVGLGGALRDLTLRLWDGTGAAVLSGDAAGYMLVYHLEILVLFVAMGGIGPLALRWENRSSARQSRQPLGLAELPG